MSYSICRIAKIKASGVTGIQIHDQREKDGVSHTNEDIDWTKTIDNVALLEQQERFRTVVSNRIAELDLKRKPRSDATVMCQCLITSDNDFFKKKSRQDQNEYFKQSLNFIKERYGENNLVSAIIHYDERTPHMHVNFVPVTEDGRLSAKDLFSPKSLRVLQDDFNRFIREKGYDLQRGEIDTKRKHLEVEEYKLETKYADLKAKEQELERLDKIDKTVDLRAEKGRLTYSTKEVEAIKDQNRSLKVDNYSKDKIIQGIKHDLKIYENRLLKAQNEIIGTELHLERLKDLECENRALQDYRKSNQTIDQAMEQFDQMKEQAYSLGNKLIECKELYHNAINERERLIKLSNTCEKIIKNYDNKIEDIKNLDKEILISISNATSLRAELDNLKGIFKKKAREECQLHLVQQEKESERLLSRLQVDHDTKSEYIPHKIQDYITQKQNHIKEKNEVIKQTDKLEQVRDKAIYSYKWHKALADCQQVDFREITYRLNAKIKLRPGEDKTFRLTQADRKQLLKDFEGNVKPRTLEKCKANFDLQDILERQERDMMKINPNELNQSRGIER